MNWFTNLFHTHAIVYTSRTLVGYGSRDCSVGPVIDWQPTNIFIVEGYCITCNKSFKGRTEELKMFHTQQPYDKDTE